ncbi:MAG: hypothetical protein ACRDJU_00610, partial [Actinomycetota bacterium]
MEPGQRRVRTRRDREKWLIATLLDPVVWILLLSGTLEVLTGDPWLHATLLYVVAAVLAADAIRRRVKGLGPVLAVEEGPGAWDPVATSPRRLSWIWIVAGA